MQLKAIHQIRRAVVPGVAADPKTGKKAVPPKSETIVPGQIFEAKPEEAAGYLKLGAAARVGDEGPFLAPKKAQPIAAKQNAPEAKAAGPESSLSEETSESSQGDSDTAPEQATDEGDEEDLVG